WRISALVQSHRSSVTPVPGSSRGVARLSPFKSKSLRDSITCSELVPRFYSICVSAVKCGRVQVDGERVPVSYIVKSSQKISHFVHRHEPSVMACEVLILQKELDVLTVCKPASVPKHHIRTGCGSVSVIVYGDPEKPAPITYPDLALNCECICAELIVHLSVCAYMSCFQGLFFCPEAASLLLHNFCIYHISPPGHEFLLLELPQELLQLGVGAICPDDPIPSVEDLADQIVEILNYFG
ncbi:hypothetical protein S245_004921, partial [Arachis hypogaea]